MPWEEVHAEACRWEHVMSEAVERRVYELLHKPTTSPYGNPIPGLDELVPGSVAMVHGTTVPLSEAAGNDARRVIVRSIAEPIQDNSAVMTLLHRVGAMPGASVRVHRSPGGITVGSGGEYAELSDEVSSHLLVELGSTVES
jgi:DtxR family Mn-dependent transcriptional regulator